MTTPVIGLLKRSSLRILTVVLSLVGVALTLAFVFRYAWQPTHVRSGARGVKVIALHLKGVDGLSGLTMDGDGTLWAVPEAARALVRIEGHRMRTAAVLDLLPHQMEAESITWLGENRFAIGTEAVATTRRHEIFVAERKGKRMHAAGVYSIEADLLGIQPTPNQGIEGLCHSEGLLVAALETPGLHGGRRFALVAHRPVADTGEWTPNRVYLTSETGKISALDCVTRNGSLVVHAIERHYEVMHLIRFVLTPGRGSETVEAVIVRDLSRSVGGAPNFEGLVVRKGVAWIVVDNYYGRETGPNEIVRIELGRR